MPNPSPEAARRNLARYPWYVGGVAAYAWMPVFFLYFSDHLPLSDVLALEAVYYIGVVALEVPSGYFSDRVGRRPTLLIATAALLAAYLTFALATGFWTLAAAQLLLAAGLAFNSGTDTSFHYSSLVAARQEDTYADREARLGRLALGVTAAACLAGGALGMIDLRLPYALAALAALAALIAALDFTEPPRHDADSPPLSPARALRACLQHMRASPVGWVFAVSLSGVVVEHIPYEFIQRYMQALTTHADAPTTLTTGAHAAIVDLIAALAAGWSVLALRRLGLRTTLLGAVALQVALIALMAWTLHPAVAALLLLRAAPSSLREAPTRAFLAPRIPPSLQATYLSLQSLAGRLAFAALLLTLAWTTPQDDGWQRALLTAAGVAGALLLLLAAAATRIKQPE